MAENRNENKVSVGKCEVKTQEDDVDLGEGLLKYGEMK
jgi:hypothetical protein